MAWRQFYKFELDLYCYTIKSVTHFQSLGPANVSSPSFFSHERRAPGCEMKSLQKQMDYDQKRLMATRAIQSKPTAGEPRTPVGSWSGLGFSNSMPENVIREKLEETSSSARPEADSVFKLDADPIFGNSSAFDALLHKKAVSNLATAASAGILPSDDLPTVLANSNAFTIRVFFLFATNWVSKRGSTNYSPI